MEGFIQRLSSIGGFFHKMAPFGSDVGVVVSLGPIRAGPQRHALLATPPPGVFFHVTVRLVFVSLPFSHRYEPFFRSESGGNIYISLKNLQFHKEKTGSVCFYLPLNPSVVWSYSCFISRSKASVNGFYSSLYKELYTD